MRPRQKKERRELSTIIKAVEDENHSDKREKSRNYMTGDRKGMEGYESYLK